MIARVKNKYGEVGEKAYNWWAMSEKVTNWDPKIRGSDSSSLTE